jgi:Ino eighty subunit 1
MARNHPSIPRDRKALFAIKRADAEPLTRADLQYDLLKSIFDDEQAVFTDPFDTLDGKPAGSKVTFRDLYVNALVNSPRVSKNIKDKLVETPEFGSDFAKISLLTNVGRINTTMACELWHA